MARIIISMLLYKDLLNQDRNEKISPPQKNSEAVGVAKEAFDSPLIHQMNHFILSKHQTTLQRYNQKLPIPEATSVGSLNHATLITHITKVLWFTLLQASVNSGHLCINLDLHCKTIWLSLSTKKASLLCRVFEETELEAGWAPHYSCTVTY